MDEQRFQLGDHAYFWLRCRAATGIDQEPDAAPTLAILDSVGAEIATSTMIPVDRGRTAGLFRGSVYLGSQFSTGKHTATCTWLVSGTSYSQDLAMEILPGGDANGTVIGLYQYERPYATHLVLHTSRGSLMTRKNPRP